ncbi:MAG: PilZ domain-containing protein, partial [Acidobacteriota bacterium]|nr:PilZ domain-containing protein [Acidobacteriota bacterium]
AGRVEQTASTVTENLSRRGACVYAPFEAERGSFVLVRSAQFGLAALAAVRACRPGGNGIPRLHLEFIDRDWPLDGIA